VVIRTVLSLHAIARPGLQQDETLFVNAATLRLPGLNLPDSFHGVPLMIFPYIGALKSWLYDPVFALFGDSATVIRLPAVLIVDAGLLLAYAAVRDLVNRPVALLAFVVLCFDGSVFWLTRDDVGPSALEFLFKCAALFFAARFARAPSRLWLLLLLVTLAAGVFNKLNFIWVVNAAVAASIIVIVLHRHRLRSAWPLVATWVAGLAALYLAFALYYFGNHISTVAVSSAGGSLTQPWLNFEQGMSWVLSGTWFYTYALAPLATRTVIVWTVTVLFGIGGLASIVVPRTRSRAVAAVALTTVLVAIQTLFTPQATAGWHYVAIYPFVTVVAAYGVWAAASTVMRRAALVYATVAVAAALALTYNALLMSTYFGSLSREPSNPAWSPAIYALSRDLRHTDAHIFTADWGILNPLFALEPGTRYTELAFALENSDPANLAGLSRSFASAPGPKVFVTHANDKLVFPQANVNLFKAGGRHLRLSGTVLGADHRPVYDLYTYR
jgi:4-amino-4-deoxy-L-arabinose transferase-like glycosyltransferase